MFKLVLGILFGSLAIWLGGQFFVMRTPPSSMFRRELVAIRDHLMKTSDENREHPESLKQLVKEWKENAKPDSPKHPKYYRFLQSGTDPWGSKIFYRYDRDLNIITIQSFGPDTEDDKGLDDDVQRQYDMNNGASKPRLDHICTSP